MRWVLPVRRAKTGTRPRVRGEGPFGKEVHNQEMWKFLDVRLKEEEKWEILATVEAIALQVIFETHLYTFGGKKKGTYWLKGHLRPSQT